MIDLFDPPAQPWRPKAYMKRAVRWLIERSAAALWLDPGLGKTSITLAAIKVLKKTGCLVGPALVVAPLRVCQQTWPDEIKKWKDFSDLTFTVLHGPKKEDLLHRRPRPDVYLINYEGLEWLACGRATEPDIDRWKRTAIELVVFDELSRMKSHSSRRFKVMKKIIHLAKWRWGLTGSPASNGLMDLFAQIFMLDLGKAFGPFITKFRSTYFVPGMDGFTWQLIDGAEEKIYKKVAPIALSMSAEDYLDLPPRFDAEIIVELPEIARKAYKELERELITELQSGAVTAANAAVASSKCRQVASGGVYSENKNGKQLTHHLHDAKTDALESLITELNGQQLMIAYEWHHDLERIERRFKGNVAVIRSGMKDTEVADIIRRWNAGKIVNLAGHPRSIGHGLNLQGSGCGHVCWYSTTWDLELYDQFIRRVLRQGTTAARIMVYHLIARGTLDRVVLEAVRGKNRSQRALFDAVKKLKRS